MKKALKIIAAFSFGLYAFMLVYILYLSSRGYFGANLSLIDYIRYSSNLIPFKTISFYIGALYNNSMNIEIPIQNLLGNLLMFLPMGIYLPYFFKKLRKLGRYVLCILVVLIVSEAIQLLLRVGSFDVDDIILNISGALTGFAIFKLVERAITKKAARTNEAALSE